MAKYSIALDISRCDGCGSCLIACKDEFALNDHLPYAAAMPMMGQQFLKLKEVEQGENWKVKMDYIPIMCQHCENPVCATGLPEGAVYTTEEGAVIFDPELCKGHKEVVTNCPYGAVSWNPEKLIPQKCDLCIHCIKDGEKTTRCVESCPTQAIHFGDLEDPNSDISMFLKEKDGWVPFKPEFGTNPRLLYRELPAPFITGEVLCADKPDECVEGAKVTCKNVETGEVRETTTDFLGDFEFKFLTARQTYEITCEVAGYQPKTITLVLNAARDLEVITLDK